MTDWTALHDELAQWEREGLSLPLWWRDDDAISDSAALRQLAQLSQKTQLPVHIAVIPAHADTSLADFLSGTPHVIPLVHGWAHENHAPPDQKKTEFGAHRPLAEMIEDADRGFGKLHGLFGSRLQPVFVPPWNRISPDLVAELPHLGFKVLSTATPRKSRWAAEGLEQINTHIDPIDWKGTRGLLDEALLVDRITRLLQDRRAGRSDADEPLGLLTHHLVHDPAIWSFCERLIAVLLSGPAQPWQFGKGDRP
ncbi:polysaccharide deacetylase family protein [Aestuariivita boseongensis]|uniref:polysaccharide deacetylase family protein n=1 Tax=Aestuariivita boseongensis TaxID=1470562 RepID=UPI0006817A91|nr:polysaccharide deacetylase family protein [Aestuariivita boseongensis]